MLVWATRAGANRLGGRKKLKAGLEVGSPQGVGKQAVENTGARAVGAGHGAIYFVLEKQFPPWNIHEPARAAGEVITGHLGDHSGFHCQSYRQGADRV